MVGGGDTPSTPSVQKVSITGYAEDDPMANATIKVSDENGNLITQTTSDSDGKYTFEAVLENGKIYTLESQGIVGGKTVTLHSMFRFSADTVINANPITELKYQLVMAGKNIDEAELLIREYFSLVHGEKLEYNRFDVASPLALGMSELAKLYNGTLPIDAIASIADDILRNDALAIEQREYAFKDLLQLQLELTASSTSLMVGEFVTITLTGIENLNTKYLIEWEGVPNDNGDGGDTKTFTLDEPRDTVIGVSLYKKDEATGDKLLIQSQSIKVNFYQIEPPQTITIGSGDTNHTINSDVRINVPSGAIGAGTQISYSEVTTNSSDYLKVFNLEPSGTVFGTPMEIRVKYDTSIGDPRTLTIKRVSEDGQEDILKIKEIDYANSELVFETEHFSKFLMKHDLDYFWQHTSLEKWDEKGSEGNEIDSIRGLIVKNNSPYHYLAESLDSYCKIKVIDYYTCKEWIKNFQNSQNAKKIENAYSTFLKSVTNDYYNYDRFTNDYYIWYLLKLEQKYPGEDIRTNKDNTLADVLNNLTKEGKYAREAFDLIFSHMYTATLEGDKRKLTINMYLKALEGAEELASKTQKIAKIFKYAKVAEYAGMSADVLATVNEYAPLVADIYKDMTNVNDFRTNKHLVSVTLGKYVAEKLLSSVMLGDVYFQLLNSSFDALDKSFNGQNFVNAFNLYHPNSAFESYFSLLIGANSSNINNKYFDLRKNDKGNLQIYNYNYKTNTFITDVDAVKYMKNILISGTGLNEAMAQQHLVNIYLTLQNYAKMRFDETYRKNMLNSLKIRGATVALSILQYAKIVTINDLVSKKEAQVKKLQETPLKQKKSKSRAIQKATTTTTSDNEIVTTPVLESFDEFLGQININIPTSLWDNIQIKKISLDIDKYGIESQSSTDTTAMIFNMTSFDESQVVSKNNILKNSFTLVDDKYHKSLASIFGDLDSSQFQDSFVVVKVSFLVNYNGVDRVVSKEYEFINYVDTNDELIKELEYGNLIINIIDANTSEAISDATVSLTTANRTNMSDIDGNTKFSSITPIAHGVQVSKEGYTTRTVQCPLVEVNQTAECEVALVEGNDTVETTTPLKKTGQTLSYDEYGTEVTDGSVKDDGFYQKGITPSYTRDATKEIVTDNVTGLMWQDNAEAASVTKPWVTQENYDAGNYSDTSGDTATTYCNDLTLGGYSDWRLPSYDELESIVDYGRYSPAIDPVFVNTTSDGYWSATTFANYTSNAWLVHFYDGNDGWDDKSNSLYVRCVR